MSEMEIEQILEHAGVRVSAIRILIYRQLAMAERPLSAQELETELDSVDRSSITRTLALYMKHGLLHSVDDGSGSVRYEICRHHHDCGRDCGVEHHKDFHVHFHCRECGSTECLKGIDTPRVVLPEGYQAEMLNYVVIGVCARCARKV